MGRAARTKRQRRQTRTWHTWNPWTGKPETFQVCIGDEALQRWGRDRVRLARHGCPDRPPEFDGPHLRAWNMDAPGRPMRHPSEDSVQGIRLGVDPTATALGFWRSGNAHAGVKVSVGRRADGSFVLHHVVELGDHEHDWVDVVPDAEAARRVIEDLDANLVPALGLPPLVWVSAEELLAEMADAS